jgi:hypothetical protein
MNPSESLSNFSKTRIKPYDGMSVTADVWAQAHDEHRSARKAHDLFFHGAGIITGLEITANDPPDQYVFVSPGVALDSEGNLIVLTEAVAYDFGDAVEGELFILLGHGERETSGTENEIRYLQNEFVIAARPRLPKRPVVELARVRLGHRGNAIKNAAHPLHPDVDEIDMRYRVEVAPKSGQMVKVAVSYLGQGNPNGILAGWDYLSREVSRNTPNHLAVDQLPVITGDIQNYSLVYLCGNGTFKLDNATLKELKTFLEQGKAIIVEAFDDAADESFKPLIGGLGVTVKPLAEYDSILKSPFLFNLPPEGYQGNKVLIGKGLVYSNARYALAWSGKVSGGSGSRSDIRSALEWGVNIIQYCLGL